MILSNVAAALLFLVATINALSVGDEVKIMYRRYKDKGKVEKEQLRFKVDKVLGVGEWGKAYRAYDTKDKNRKIVIKTISGKISRDSAQHEVNTLRKMAYYVDSGLDEPRKWIALRYFQGKTLHSYFWDGDHKFPYNRGFYDKIKKSLLADLKKIHSKGIEHRDIHFGNVMMDLVNGEPKVKVIDFGNAVYFNPKSERQFREAEERDSRMAQEKIFNEMKKRF